MKLNFKEKYLIILVVLCFVVVGLYYSYAIFVTKQLQENVVVIKTTNHNIDLKVNSMKNEFEIKSKSNSNVNISFENKENSKYHYMVLVKGIKTGIKVYSSDDVRGIINGQEKKTLSVNIINDTNGDVKLEFTVQISITDLFDKDIEYSYINQIENYDHTGANKPLIGDLKLIPVNYHNENDKEGYWYKTDINNTKSVWYDYDNGIWANAVLLSNENYQKYQNKEIGTQIDLSDIEGFYVWIPRFKYYIINSSNYTNYERMNNIVFENSNDTTGTVKCTDKISNLEDTHVYSEVCADNYYQHLYDNLSTYTHPAFKDSNGFWVAKFLMSEGEKVVPNAHILKKRVTGIKEIIDKTSKSHLLTNMEYGAVVLLSNSSYGKTGNSLYDGNDTKVFQRIYVNSYEHEMTGCSSEYSGYSKQFITEKTSKCIAYNDLTNYTHYSNGVYYPIGYVGAGASTTGNIYGVYDLANINGEIVSAYTAKRDGSINNATSYYDAYSYSDYLGKVYSSNNIYNLYRYKMGDAIKEHFRSFNENGMWNGGMLVQNADEGVLIRGGNGDIKNASIYTASFENVEYEAPFRIALLA